MRLWALYATPRGCRARAMRMHGLRACARAHGPQATHTHTHKCTRNCPTDTLFGADLTIMEEGTELLHRLEARAAEQAAGAAQAAGDDGHHSAILPMFTSCCPGERACGRCQVPGMGWVAAARAHAAACATGTGAAGRMTDTTSSPRVPFTKPPSHPVPPPATPPAGWVAMVEKSNPELIPFLSS